MNRTHQLVFVFVAILLLCGALSGCGGQGSMQLSSKPRLAPAAGKPDVAELVGNNNQFAFDLYKQLGQGQTGNLFFSPYSISLGMAMVYAGARGNTATQMAAALHFSQPQEKLHAGFNSLDQSLPNSSPAPLFGEPDFQLKIANAAWGQQDYKFLPEYLDTLMQYYGAGIRTTDFKDPGKALNEINQWTKNATDGKINGALSDIPRDTRLILVNAIYFNAKWQGPFIDAGNRDFHSLVDSAKSVPMMRYKPSHENGDIHFLYAEGPDYQMVTLPYKDNRTEMVILLPAQGKFNQIEASLTSEWIQKRLEERNSRAVYLTMPKFRLEPPIIALKAALSALGMVEAFSTKPGVADFSGMDGARQLAIDDIFQKTYIQVDEKGTEAAAVTFGRVFETISGELNVVDMTIDRPFIFFIRDTQTGTLLFLGRVTSLP